MIKTTPVCFGKLQMVGDTTHQVVTRRNWPIPIETVVEMKIKGDEASDWHHLGELLPELPKSLKDKDFFDVLKDAIATLTLSEGLPGDAASYKLSFELPNPDKSSAAAKPTIPVFTHGPVRPYSPENGLWRTTENKFPLLLSLLKRITNLPEPIQKAATDLLARGYTNYYGVLTSSAKTLIARFVDQLTALRTEMAKNGYPQKSNEDTFYNKLLTLAKEEIKLAEGEHPTGRRVWIS